MDDLREMTASELVDYLREAIVSGGNDVWLTVEEVARRLSAMEQFRANVYAAIDSEDDGKDEDVLGYIRQVTLEYVGDTDSESGLEWARKRTQEQTES